MLKSVCYIFWMMSHFFFSSHPFTLLINSIREHTHTIKESNDWIYIKWSISLVDWYLHNNRTRARKCIEIARAVTQARNCRRTHVQVWSATDCTFLFFTIIQIYKYHRTPVFFCLLFQIENNFWFDGKKSILHLKKCIFFFFIYVCLEFTRAMFYWLFWHVLQNLKLDFNLKNTHEKNMCRKSVNCLYWLCYSCTWTI